MANFSAIRESFREFNMMLRDAQSWDERHKAESANRRMEEAKLESGLEQQAFNNQMAREVHQLRLTSDNRAANKLEFDIMDANRKFLLNEEATRLGMQSTEESIKNQKQDREQKALDIQKTKDLLANRDQLIEQATQAVFTDPAQIFAQNTKDIVTGLEDIDIALKELNPDDMRNASQRAHLKAARNNLEGEARKIEAKMQPQVVYENLRQRAMAARQIAQHWSSKGDQDTAGNMMNTAVALDKQAATLWNTQLDPKLKDKGGDKLTPGTMTEDQMLKNIAKPFQVETALGKTILADAAKPKVSMMSDIAVRMYTATGKDHTKLIEIQNTVQAQVNEAEAFYFESLDELKQQNGRQKAAQLKKYGMQRNKGETIDDAMRRLARKLFTQDVRTRFNDPKLRVYIPNKELRNLRTLGQN